MSKITVPQVDEDMITDLHNYDNPAAAYAVKEHYKQLIDEGNQLVREIDNAPIIYDKKNDTFKFAVWP